MERQNERGTDLLMIALAGLLALAAPAAAQSQPDSETFLEAIEEQRNDDVIDLVTAQGARDRSTCAAIRGRRR